MGTASGASRETWAAARSASAAACSSAPAARRLPSMVLHGCRRAELVGFRWSFADLDRAVLTVKRPILQLEGKLHEEPTAKSRAGDRLVFLDAETAQLLREHHRAQPRARMKAGPGARSRELVMGESCQVKPGGAGGLEPTTGGL